MDDKRNDIIVMITDVSLRESKKWHMDMAHILHDRPVSNRFHIREHVAIARAIGHVQIRLRRNEDLAVLYYKLRMARIRIRESSSKLDQLQIDINEQMKIYRDLTHEELKMEDEFSEKFGNDDLLRFAMETLM